MYNFVTKHSQVAASTLSSKRQTLVKPCQALCDCESTWAVTRVTMAGLERNNQAKFTNSVVETCGCQCAVETCAVDTCWSGYHEFSQILDKLSDNI